MNFKELQKKAQRFVPVFILESVISRKLRKYFEIVLLAGLFGTIYFVFYGSNHFLGGLFFILFAVLLLLLALDSYALSFYFKEPISNKEVGFELAHILYLSNEDDPTKSFLLSDFGYELRERLLLSDETVVQYLDSDRERPLSFDLPEDGSVLTFAWYAQAMLSADVSFKDLLFSQGIEEKDFANTVLWMQRIYNRNKKLHHWWTKEYLLKVPSIGVVFSYGKAYELEKFSRPLEEEADEFSLEYYAEEVEQLERIMSRSKEANALIVGESGVGKIEIVSAFGMEILHGHVNSVLEHKKILLLDYVSLIATTKTKDEFENELIRLMNQTITAGNIILVIENLPSFIQDASVGMQSDVLAILDSYLNSNALQVIALASTQEFHTVLKKNPQISKRFETVRVRDSEGEVLLHMVEDRATRIEQNSSVIFSYQSLQEVVRGAERYITTSVTRENAIDLLTDVVAFVYNNGRYLVTKEDVVSVIESETGIPTGEAGEEERQKLLNLEALLHERIVGQDNAVVSVSEALRRARSGITNPKRPIGSFLFLGPTGVGKTETTKALASIFFGSEDKIVRLDMSEYNTADALDKLIGSFDTGEGGILSSKVADTPYGVLLLDEFEKANQDVHDLFLQILDEGEFSDMHGNRINVKNMIIIATSNAGSDRIFEALSSGKSLDSLEETIVDDILHEHIFRPELVNRFDGIVVFHPLQLNELEIIAGLELKKLSDRIADRGFRFEITPEVIHFVAEKGNNPKFGARALNRTVNNTIENAIAQKILAGGLSKGSTIQFSAEELQIMK